jgi:hypothetical protein
MRTGPHKGDVKTCCGRRNANRPDRRPEGHTGSRNAALPPLVMKLIDHGIAEKTAIQLVDAREDVVEKQLPHIAFLINAGKPPKNPAGWLRDAILADWELPSGMVERQRVRERTRHSREQAQQEAARQAAAEAETQSFEVWFAAHPEQEEILREALTEEEDEFTRRWLDGRPDRIMLMRSTLIELSGWKGVRG